MMRVGRTKTTVGSALRRPYVVLLMVLLMALTLTAAVGCSGDGGTDATETTTAATGSEETTSGVDIVVSDEATGNQTFTIGGKTPEEYKAAIPQLQEKAQAEPDNLTALQDLAIAQYQTADYAGATTTYQQMLAIDDDPMTRNNYANVLRDAGQTEEAKAQYQQAIAADPTLTVAYINLSSVLLTEDKLDEALAILDKGIENITGEEKERLQSIKDSILAKQTTTTAAQ